MHTNPGSKALSSIKHPGPDQYLGDKHPDTPSSKLHQIGSEEGEHIGAGMHLYLYL